MADASSSSAATSAINSAGNLTINKPNVWLWITVIIGLVLSGIYLIKRKK